jgi:PAS domain S-box-containing protein
VIGTHLDITQRKRTEAALVDSERRLRTMADNLPAVVCYIDRQERYRFISAEVRRAFDVDPDASLGHTIREIRGEEMYAVLAPHIAAVLRGEPTRFEYRTQRDGRLRHFRSDYIPDLAADGAVRGFFTITTQLAALAEKVVDCIRPPFQLEGRRVDVSTSVGVAACTGESVSAADMMARADAALYAAKRQGRNRFALN